MIPNFSFQVKKILKSSRFQIDDDINNQKILREYFENLYSSKLGNVDKMVNS
jgi:hypothetical protein